jgi:hypothetical protein
VKKLLVFVSSTYKDLLEERQAAVEAILKAGHIPAGMELFAAGNKSQIETIYNWIDECDVYCLILGGRYGSVDPQTGKSYTELEYDYAVSKNKPFFSVVLKKEAYEKRVRERGVDVVESENPKLLESFKEKVLGSISSFFEDCKDIKLTIHESMSAYSRDPSLPGWVSGREVQDMLLLRKENDELKQKLAERAARPASVVKSKPTATDDNFEILEKILGNIILEVPKEAFSDSPEENVSMTLQELLNKASDTLVAGVTSSSSGPYPEFLYRTVFPKLQIHGLADNEKPIGVFYRRSFLNKEGQRYLAWIARKSVIAAS